MSQVKWQNIAEKKKKSPCFVFKRSSFLLFFFLLKNIIVLFIFGWAGLGLHCCMGFSLVVVSGGYSLVSVHGLCSSWALEHRLNSCDARA